MATPPLLTGKALADYYKKQPTKPVSDVSKATVDYSKVQGSRAVQAAANLQNEQRMAARKPQIQASLQAEVDQARASGSESRIQATQQKYNDVMGRFEAEQNKIAQNLSTAGQRQLGSSMFKTPEQLKVPDVQNVGFEVQNNVQPQQASRLEERIVNRIASGQIMQLDTNALQQALDSGELTPEGQQQIESALRSRKLAEQDPRYAKKAYEDAAKDIQNNNQKYLQNEQWRNEELARRGWGTTPPHSGLIERYSPNGSGGQVDLSDLILNKGITDAKELYKYFAPQATKEERMAGKAENYEAMAQAQKIIDDVLGWKALTTGEGTYLTAQDRAQINEYTEAANNSATDFGEAPQNYDTQGSYQNYGNQPRTNAPKIEAKYQSDLASLNAAITGLPPEYAGVAQGYLGMAQQALEDERAQNLLLEETEESINRSYEFEKTSLEDKLAREREYRDGAIKYAEDLKNEEMEFYQERERKQIIRLEAEKLKAERDGEKQIRKQIDSMEIIQALSGMLGSQSSNYSISQAEIDGERALDDILRDYDYRIEDTAMAYTETYRALNREYKAGVADALETYRSAMDSIDSQFITNYKGRESALLAAKKEAAENVSIKRNAFYTGIINANTVAKQAYDSAKQEAQEKEDLAIRRIDALLGQYPMEEVKDIVMQLGKDVKSFNVEDLLKAKTYKDIEAIDKAIQSKTAFSTYANNYLPSNLQYNTSTTPTFEEYLAEETKNMKFPMNEKDNLEYMKNFFTKKEEEYNATYSPIDDNLTRAGKAYLSGRYGNGVTSLDKTAKAFGVTQNELNAKIDELQTSGFTQDTPILNETQQKVYLRLMGDLDSDPTYKKARSAMSFDTVVQTSLLERNGVADIAAINALQSGLIDEGATVREGDVALIRSTVTWVDSILSSYPKEALMDGAFLPQPTRNRLSELSTKIKEARIRAFDDMLRPQWQERAKKLGLNPDDIPSISQPNTYTNQEAFDVTNFLRSNGF